MAEGPAALCAAVGAEVNSRGVREERERARKMRVEGRGSRRWKGRGACVCRSHHLSGKKNSFSLPLAAACAAARLTALRLAISTAICWEWRWFGVG